MASSVDLKSSIQKFYDSLKTPVFLCSFHEVLWHNDSAKALFNSRQFRKYLLQIKQPQTEKIKVFICDDFYYKIVIRPFEDYYFLEVIESWPLTSTLDVSISLEAPEVVDAVVRNSAHKIFQSINSLSKVLEKSDEISSLKYIDVIANSTYCVLRTTNLCYEYGQLMKGKLNLELVDIFSEIDALCSTVNSLMQKSGVPFIWKVPNEKFFCDIDIHKFSFALFHLICNAYTFTSAKNEIKVIVEHGDEGVLKVEVLDKGCGVSSGILDKVFTPYFSYDKMTGDIAGCGLGLTYAAVFAKNSGGTLTLCSDNGQTSVLMIIPVSNISQIDGMSSHVVEYGAGKYGNLVATMAKAMLEF